MQKDYIKLEGLDIYKMSVELGRKAWKIYEKMNWQEKKIMGDQFIRAVDSVGANIAEGYGRFHYLDRIKFYYNARGSLFEAKYWLLLLEDRKKIKKETYQNFLKDLEELHKQLNVFIKSCRPKQ
ncbi:MAG: four helix bundle protein [Parcubacteria group bacterium CG_4_10_14_0_8_um_filter_35_7]|nr:MAG: four helix bundle protein [Parcubacteria group bacterium CG23_combo_of_CG06-09_8_20_14_all_35_9]PIY78469.1 MAG: four helix bundle protein [Parcubacteria group bacterium CG_4_10_14_0_8_um_filter_35_7]